MLTISTSNPLNQTQKAQIKTKHCSCFSPNYINHWPSIKLDLALWSAQTVPTQVKTRFHAIVKQSMTWSIWEPADFTHRMLIADGKSKQREGCSDSSQNSESCVQKQYRQYLGSHKTLKSHPRVKIQHASPHFKCCDPKPHSVHINCTFKVTVHP